MYKVVRQLNEDTLEVFSTFNNLKEAEYVARAIEVFLGYKRIFIIKQL